MRFEPGLKLARHSKLGEYFEGKSVAPINVEISPSGKCDATCSWCFYRQEGGSIPGLDGKLFRESRMQGLVEELAGMGVNSVSWTGGGEPNLHPAFSKFVEWTKWAGLKQGLFTNALKEINYDPTLFEWIRVSKTNKPWNIDSLKVLRQSKTLGMCINYTGNDEEVKEALKIAEELDSLKESSEHSTYVQVRPALKIHGKKFGKLGVRCDPEVPDIKHPLIEITDYKFLGTREDRNYTECEAYHFNPFIWQDGDVDVCGYQRKIAEYNLGNVYDLGEKGRFRNIMKRAPKTVPVIDTCLTCCKLNSMNSTIKHMKNLEDIDFP